MNLIHKIETWGDSHQSKWFALLRLSLGLIIFFKGIVFIRDTGAINGMIANSAVAIYSVMLAHYVALAHLMGGFFNFHRFDHQSCCVISATGVDRRYRFCECTKGILLHSFGTRIIHSSLDSAHLLPDFWFR